MLKKFLRARFIKGQRLAKDSRGAAAIEFALVAPVFFVALGSTMETGVMLFSEYVLQSSVQEAARLVRTGQAQSSTLTAAQFKTEICKLSSIVMNCAGGVTVYMRADTSFANLNGNTPSYLNVGNSYGGGPSSSSYDCGDPAEAVAVIATYDWNLIMPGMNYFGNVDGNSKRRIAGFAMFRNEPFPAGSNCG